MVSAYAPMSGETDRDGKGGVFERLGRSDDESAENREGCSRS